MSAWTRPLSHLVPRRIRLCPQTQIHCSVAARPHRRIPHEVLYMGAYPCTFALTAILRFVWCVDLRRESKTHCLLRRGNGKRFERKNAGNWRRTNSIDPSISRRLCRDQRDTSTVREDDRVYDFDCWTVHMSICGMPTFGGPFKFDILGH